MRKGFAPHVDFTKRPPVEAYRPQDSEHYVVEITSWQWDYSFGLEHFKLFNRYIGEYRALQVIGNLVRPRSLGLHLAELTVFQSRAFDEDKLRQEPIAGIGILERQKPRLHGHVRIPLAAAPLLAQMLAVGHYKFVRVEGSRFHYRQAKAFGISFASRYDPADLAAEEAPTSARRS